MKRKIIRQGHNTLTATLPINWVKKLNLKAGDEIDVFEDAGSLIINGKQNFEIKSVAIDITDFSIPMIWRFIQSAYREGYDEIKLTYDLNKKEYESAYNYYDSKFTYSKFGEKPQKKLAIDMINEFVNRFIGLAIIDYGNNFCTIREMGELSSKEFDSSLRRIFVLLIELFDETLDLIKNNKVNDLSISKKIHAIDINIDRFIDYCCRINNKINDSSYRKKKQLMFSTLFLLELLGDEFKYIANNLSKAKTKVDELLNFAEDVKKHFELYYNLFYKYDRKKAIEFGELDFKVYKKYVDMKESKNRDINSIRRHLMQISKFTFSLMELRIGMEF